jgi:hypothetical protein
VNFDLQHPSPHRLSLSDSVSPSTSKIVDAACEIIDGVTLETWNNFWGPLFCGHFTFAYGRRSVTFSGCQSNYMQVCRINLNVTSSPGFPAKLGGTQSPLKNDTPTYDSLNDGQNLPGMCLCATRRNESSLSTDTLGSETSEVATPRYSKCPSDKFSPSSFA